MKFSLKYKFDKVCGCAIQTRDPPLVQLTTICHSLGFTMVLYPGCPSFSQGTNIFPYLAEMILCASMGYKMLVIKGTIARSGAIFLSKITSYLAFKKEKEKKKKKIFCLTVLNILASLALLEIRKKENGCILF